MQNNQRLTPFIASQDFLQLIAKACRNYNEEFTSERFISFLQDHIFCKLGDVFVELYFSGDCQNTFSPYLSGPEPGTRKVTTGTPNRIQTVGPLYAELFAQHTRLVVNNDIETPPFLLATGNQTHAIFPILQEAKMVALLYIGCRENLPFPEEYLQGIQTITLLIGSWLKSKDIIYCLRRSLASLEYSEQLQQALYEISEQAHVASAQEDLFSSLHTIVGRLINARNFVIALREERNGEHYIKFNYYSDERDPHFQGMEIRVDPKAKLSMISFIIQNGKALLLKPEDVDQFCHENDIKYLGSKAYSLVGVPFYLDHLAGVVLVQSYSEIIYTEKDKNLLVYVARHIGDALARKKTIDDLRNVNEVFSLFMHYSTAYIIIKEVTESQNRVLQTSDNFKEITGISSKEMIGMNMADLFSADFAAKVIADDWKVVSSGVPLQREQHWNNRTYTTVKFLISQKNKTLLAAFSIDITERKQMEDALRENESRYRVIFEKSPLGMVRFSSEGKVLDFNDKFIEIMGSTREKLLGFNAAQQSTPLVQETMKKAMNGKIASCEESYTSFTGNKNTYLRGIFSPVFPGQSPTEIIATIEDITELKEHEKKQHRIEKLESLGVLAGGIAHDFNNILTGIMANISFAKVLVDAEHKALNPLTEAEKASRRAAELAQQLLTFAKGGEPNKKIISVQHLIPEAISLMLHGSNVRAIVDVPDTIHAVKADEGQISQVLNNLIINGTQAMPGGGTLSVIAENVFLPDSNKFNLPGGTYIKVIIQDEGCGIAQADKEKIFDPYYTTKITGTGLGLASAYSIIAKHKGHIDVRSVLHKGTVFTIYLPSIGESYTEHSEAASEDNHPHKEGSILVMDDEEMIRDIAEAMLTHLGYLVTTSTQGEETIKLFRESLASEKPFLAVIVDLTIPGGLGGKEVAEHILAMFPAACLIVSSGYSNDPIMANYQEYGFRAAIAKPYSIEEFAQVLNSLPVSDALQ